MEEHVRNFLHQERHRPLKQIHIVWQMEGCWHVLVLLDVHLVIFNQDHSALVMIFVAIIRRAKNRNNRRKGSVSAPSVHFVSIWLHLMGTNDRDEIIVFQYLFNWVKTEFYRAFTLGVLAKLHFPCLFVIHWI